MSSVLMALVTIIGIPLCAIAVIAGVWQYPYLIVIPVGACYMLRALYRRANARFQQDVAALVRAQTESRARRTSPARFKAAPE